MDIDMEMRNEKNIYLRKKERKRERDRERTHHMHTYTYIFYNTNILSSTEYESSTKYILVRIVLYINSWWWFDSKYVEWNYTVEFVYKLHTYFARFMGWKKKKEKKYNLTKSINMYRTVHTSPFESQSTKHRNIYTFMCERINVLPSYSSEWCGLVGLGWVLNWIGLDWNVNWNGFKCELFIALIIKTSKKKNKKNKGWL